LASGIASDARLIGVTGAPRITARRGADHSFGADLTRTASRLNENPPETGPNVVQTVAIQAPKHLSARSAKLYRRLAADYRLDREPHALETLRLACEALDRCAQARDAIVQDGPFVVNRFGEKRAHPAVGVDLSRNVFNPGVHRGLDAYRHFVEQVDEMWEDFQIEPEEFIDAGDNVFVASRMSGRGRGSGVEVEMRAFAIWTLREGKVSRIAAGYRDRAEALEAAGLRE
jgi:phage terminase small subunit